MRTWVPSLALLSGLRISVAMSCGVGCRRGSRVAVAVALIRPPARELPYAASAALKTSYLTKSWQWLF